MVKLACSLEFSFALLALTAVLNGSLYAQNPQWHIQDTLPKRQTPLGPSPVGGYSDIVASDSLHCIAVGSIVDDKGKGSGLARRTTDGGRTWTNVMQQGPTAIAIAWPTPQLCLIAADSSTVMRSSDGGDTWDSIATHEIANGRRWTLNRIAMSDARNGLVSTSLSVLRTSDGGVSWNRLTLPANNYPVDIAALSESVLIVASDVYDSLSPSTPFYFQILRSEDAGAHWSSTRVDSVINTIFFLDSLEGWSAGMGMDGNREIPIINHTTDGGRSWREITVPGNRQLWGISFADSDHGIVSSYGGRLYQTSNGGSSWTLIDSIDHIPSNNFIRPEITYPSAGNVWVASGYGQILHYGVEHVDGISSDATDLFQQSFVLTPNPVRDAVALRYHLAHEGNVLIDVIDMSGRTIMSIPEIFAGGGDHSRMIQTRGLADGEYLVRLRCNGVLIVQKLLHVR